MSIGYVFDEAFLAHRAPGGDWHPECPERLAGVLAELRTTGLLDRMVSVPAREATRAELEAAHAAAYLDRLQRALDGREGYVDPDTFHDASTRTAAWRAAGSAAELAVRVARGELDAGIALVRPPGHHATRDRSMGFCLLNNAAVAVRAVQAQGLAQRILLLDWDVHHGNGTENIFWDDPAVLYLSIHQSPCYPGTGPATAAGGLVANGKVINVPLPPGAGDLDYLEVFEQVVRPAATWFCPDFVLVSAGYDAWSRDPLADMEMTRAGFATLGRRLFDLAGRTRLAAVLEGGYDRDALAHMVADFVRIMLGDDVPGVVETGSASEACAAAIQLVLTIHATGWANPR